MSGFLSLARAAEAGRYAPDPSEADIAFMREAQRRDWLAANEATRIHAEEEAREQRRRAKALPRQLQASTIGFMLEQCVRGGNGKLKGVERIMAPAVKAVLLLLLQRLSWYTLEHAPHRPLWTIADLARCSGFEGRGGYGERTVRSALRAIVDLGLAVRLDPNAVRFRLTFRTADQLRAILLRASRAQRDARRTAPPVPPCVVVGLPPYSFQEIVTDDRPPLGGDGRLLPPEKLSRSGGGPQPVAAPPTAHSEALARAGVITPSAGADDAREPPPRSAAPPAPPRRPEAPAPARVITPSAGAGRDERPRGGGSTAHASAPRALERPFAVTPANDPRPPRGAPKPKPEAAADNAAALRSLLAALEAIP